MQQPPAPTLGLAVQDDREDLAAFMPMTDEERDGEVLGDLGLGPQGGGSQARLLDADYIKTFGADENDESDMKLPS